MFLFHLVLFSYHIVCSISIVCVSLFAMVQLIKCYDSLAVQLLLSCEKQANTLNSSG